MSASLFDEEPLVPPAAFFDAVNPPTPEDAEIAWDRFNERHNGRGPMLTVKYTYLAGFRDGVSARGNEQE